MRRIRRNPINARAIRERVNSISCGNPVDISKMHGHMTVILTDVHTGKKEVINEDNMMTNALQRYFSNLGLLNTHNINQSNMVEELLGGVLGFDTALSENVNLLHPPAGVKMTFNGSVGTLNNSAPTELGSYSADESGWQQDGSYVQTYDFSTSQANGTIACVCLTSKAYGYVGEGNSLSNVKKSQGMSLATIGGSPNMYSIPGNPYVFNVNLSDSSCYTFGFEDVEVEGGEEGETVTKGVIRKYRLPISKVNIKGTTTAPVMLSETYVTIDDELASIAYNPQGGTSAFLMNTVDGQVLYLWNANYSINYTWGDNWTQYLWTITASGISRRTITNTSGIDLDGLNAAHISGNYCFIAKTRQYSLDTRTIIVLNLTSGSMSIINNSTGVEVIGWYNDYQSAGWRRNYFDSSGRLVTSGARGFVFDAVNMTAYPTNSSNSYGNMQDVDGFLFRLGMNIYRSISYLATINNLDNPVVKTSDKTMKVVYRITFDEQ